MDIFVVIGFLQNEFLGQADHWFRTEDEATEYAAVEKKKLEDTWLSNKGKIEMRVFKFKERE